MPSKFNHTLLLIGRNARGMSQIDLAKRAGVTQGHLSKIENGLTEPSNDVIRQVADVLDFPERFFLQPDTTYGLPVSVHPMHRKKSSVGRRALDRIHADLNIILMHIKKLFRATEITENLRLPQLDIDEYGGDAERIAELVRRIWLLPPGPVENLTDCLEQAGVIVVLCDFFGTNIDGITYSVSDLPPCVFLNRDQPADRMRFTLAHELAHLVMHSIPNSEMEQQANLFASALLMPAENIRENLIGRVNLQRLASLKPIWRFSMQAILMRAKTIGAITANQNRYLWQQINANKIRFREPPELDFAPEEPKVLPKILRLYLEKLEYSVDDLAKTLHVKAQELRRLYQFPGSPFQSGHLRVVKG